MCPLTTLRRFHCSVTTQSPTTAFASLGTNRRVFQIKVSHQKSHRVKNVIMIFMQIISMGVYALKKYLADAEERRQKAMQEAEEEAQRQIAVAREAEENERRRQVAAARQAEERERNKNNFGGFKKGFLL